jgi:hypothetical protein
LVSRALATAAHDQYSTYPEQTLNCPGQPISSGYHGQHSYMTSETYGDLSPNSEENFENLGTSDE